MLLAPRDRQMHRRPGIYLIDFWLPLDRCGGAQDAADRGLFASLTTGRLLPGLGLLGLQLNFSICHLSFDVLHSLLQNLGISFVGVLNQGGADIR